MGDFVTHVRRTGTVLLDDVVAEQATDVLRAAEDESALILSIELPTGRRIPLPSELTTFLLDIVDDVSHGRSVSLRTMPEELSTSVAAAELGISRPTLMKLIAREQLPAHKVGTHTRVRREDVASFKAEREGRIRAAAEELLLLNESDTES